MNVVSHRPLRVRLVALLVLGLAAPLPASGQVVQGRLLDAASHAPVEGAVVLLLDGCGR